MLAHLLFTSLLSSLVLADRYRFGISNIAIRTTRDLREDDLVLAIGAVSNSAEIGSETFYLGGGHNSDEVIALNNLTQEITIDDRSADLSIAFGLVNIGDGPEIDIALQLGANILKVASKVVRASPAGVAFKLGSLFVEQLPDLLNCKGMVVLGSATYSPEVLQELKLNEPAEGTESFINDVPFNCAPLGSDSNYEVTWYLEVLERTGSGADANGASSVKPSMVLNGGLGAVAMFFAYFL